MRGGLCAGGLFALQFLADFDNDFGGFAARGAWDSAIVAIVYGSV